MDPATGIYSCDDHLDLYAVPPDLWQTRLPHAQAASGPRVETRDGRPFWVCEDRVMGRSGQGKSAAAKSLSAIGRAGIEDVKSRDATAFDRALQRRDIGLARFVANLSRDKPEHPGAVDVRRIDGRDLELHFFGL